VSRAASGDSHLYLITLSVQLSFGFDLYVKFPAYRYLFIEEDHLVQNLSVVFYLVALVLAFRLFIREHKHNSRMIVLLIPALIAVLGGLDEIGWGERLFDLRMPVIADNKINALHDLIDVARETYGRQYTVVRAGLFVGSVISVLRLALSYREKIFRAISLVPRDPSYFAWGLFTVLGTVAVFLDQAFTVVGYATFFEEMLEMNAAFVLILATLETHKAIRAGT
jgi:hypothetical protein